MAKHIVVDGEKNIIVCKHCGSSQVYVPRNCNLFEKSVDGFMENHKNCKKKG